MAGELRLVVVEVHMSPWEAHITRALLHSEGVPAFLANEHHVWANWSASLMLGGVRLLVPALHLEPARAVLAMRDRGELQAALAAQIGPSVDTCQKCGSTEFTENRSWFSVALSLALLFSCKAFFPPIKNRKCTACGSVGL